MRCQRGYYHTSLDCVWGFTQLPIDEETSRILALNTRRGILVPKVLYFGPKQGPAIFQAFADSVLGHVRGPEGEECVTVFVDNCTISTTKEKGETDDSCFERHLKQLEIFFTAASKRNVQFKLIKSKFVYGQIPLLGFIAGRGERKVQPEKAQALKDARISTRAIVDAFTLVNDDEAFVEVQTEVDQVMSEAVFATYGQFTELTTPILTQVN